MEGVPVAVPAETTDTSEATEPALGAATDEGEAAPNTEPIADQGTDPPEPTGEGN
jgi:hypothetical protein